MSINLAHKYIYIKLFVIKGTGPSGTRKNNEKNNSVIFLF